MPCRCSIIRNHPFVYDNCMGRLLLSVPVAKQKLWLCFGVVWCGHAVPCWPAMCHSLKLEPSVSDSPRAEPERHRHRHRPTKTGRAWTNIDNSFHYVCCPVVNSSFRPHRPSLFLSLSLCLSLSFAVYSVPPCPAPVIERSMAGRLCCPRQAILHIFPH